MQDRKKSSLPLRLRGGEAGLEETRPSDGGCDNVELGVGTCAPILHLESTSTGIYELERFAARDLKLRLL